METAAIIFVICLVLPAIWWILVISRDIKDQAAAAKKRERATLKQPRLTPHQAASRARALARRQADPAWKSATPSGGSDVFKNFNDGDNETSLDSSLVKAAFEKYTEEMKAR